MKKTDNPFIGLDINYPKAKYCDGSIKQKTFFEHGSDESNAVPFEDRVKIIAKFVFDGYDMHKLVNNYLNEKDALDDDGRKYGIARTFKIYADQIFFEPETEEWETAVKKILIGDDNKTSSEQMGEAIKSFIEVVNKHLRD